MKSPNTRDLSQAIPAKLCGTFLVLLSLLAAPRAAGAVTLLHDLTSNTTGLVNGVCILPPALSVFAPTDPQVWLYFDMDGTQSGDAVTIDYYRPDGGLYTSFNPTISAPGAGGYYCFAYYINLDGATAASYPGTWTIRTYYNQSSVPLFSLNFTVGAAPVITTVVGSEPLFTGAGGPAASATFGLVNGVLADSQGNVYVSDNDNCLVTKINSAGIISVVAGNGVCSYSGDGGPATSAALNQPAQMAMDSAGNLYIADFNNGVVRKVTSAGIMSTVAGTGGCCYTGDGGPAAKATLFGPTGLAVDSAGNLYIADTEDNAIRKVNSSGIISTVAGTGTAGFSGDGGPATSAQLNNPRGVAVDAAGNIYIGDTSNFRVRKVMPSGIISTIAGTGIQTSSGDGGPAVNANLSFPEGLALDSAGDLYIADYARETIRKINALGIISTVAGNGLNNFGGDGGPATSAALAEPQSVSVDPAGNLYIADFQNHRVRVVNPAGTITTFAGQILLGNNGPATRALLAQPYHVAFDGSGDMYIADIANNMIRKVSAAGIITTYAGTGARGFSGDGGPATSALLSQPEGVAVDASGNVYYSDTPNNRVRKITPGGIISTIAGTGACTFSGDGGPASSAALCAPRGLAVNSGGNLYIADYNNSRVRRVAIDGTIGTIAGTGNFSAFGDGGPATSAGLAPWDLAFDGAGNLYVVDAPNFRIRKITPGGTISTVAGNGTAGSSGDNGPATSAEIPFSFGVAVDVYGNLFIATGSAVIRQVEPTGIITTVAGAGYNNFSGDGGAATNAAIWNPQGVAVDSVGNLYISDTSNNRIRKVLLAPGSAPTISVSQAGLSFTAAAGAPGSTFQQVLVSSAVSGLAWTAHTAVASGSGWLTATPSVGVVPGAISVSVSAANLAAGTYSGTVTVVSALASPTTIAIPVTFTVNFAAASQLVVQPSALNFQTRAGGANPPNQTLYITDPSGTALAWTAATTTSGGNWLNLSLSSSGTSSSPANATHVSVNIAGLLPGTYQGAVAVSSSTTGTTTGTTTSVPVTLLLAPGTQQTQTILLSQTGMSFTGVQGGTAVPSQSFGILNTGSGVMNWTASVTTQGGGNWLSISASSGSSIANSLQIPTVTVAVNTTGLSAGVYSGWVKMAASGAINTPQFVTVKLNVLPVGGNPGVIVRPTGLIFAALANTSSPSSQTVDVATAIPAGSDFIGGVIARGTWPQAAPLSATISVGQEQAISVQPSLGTLAPGVYQGTLTLQFHDGSAQTVAITFLVASASRASAQRFPGESAAGCTPTQMLAQVRNYGSNYGSSAGNIISLSAGYGQLIEVQLQDDCRNAVTNATAVIASFSDGETLTLNNLQNGIYSSTWNPQTPAGQVTMTVTAFAPPLPPVTVQASGLAQANPSAASIYSGGVVNGASFAKGAALAPGGIVSIFGANLAQSSLGSSSLPLPSLLAGATVTVGGIDVPLFYSSSGQINAQLPFELTPNSQTQVIVRTVPPGASAPIATVPEPISIGVSSPGIFTINAAGQGAILLANSSIFAAPAGSIPGASAAPAVRGQYISIYCSGLGAVVNQPPTGTAAGGTSTTIASPVVTIGGLAANVSFSGLAPGFVGLYQVNVQVPSGVTPGGAVPLILTMNGAVSNTVTIAVQ